MTSKEGLEALRDGHDEAMKKFGGKDGGTLGKSSDERKGWFGSIRKASRTSPTSRLASEGPKSDVSSDPIVETAVTGVDANLEMTTSPDSFPETQTTIVTIQSDTVGGSSPIEVPPDAPQPLGSLPDTKQSTSPSKGSWFARKEPPAISITNPTPTNSPSKLPAYPSYIPHSPPNPSPLSASTTSPPHHFSQHYRQQSQTPQQEPFFCLTKEGSVLGESYPNLQRYV